MKDQGNRQNIERYLKVERGKNIVFRDSLQFLIALLEQLTALLAKKNRNNFYNLLKVVSQIYPRLDVELLETKSVFCYDYVDFFARLD